MLIDFDERVSNPPSGWCNDRLHFFKYMSADTAKIVLANKTLRWSTPALLNDPFDVQFDAAYRFDRDVVVRGALDKLWSFYIGETSPPSRSPLGILAYNMRRFGVDMTRVAFEEELAPGVLQGLNDMEGGWADMNSHFREQLGYTKVLCLSARPNSTLMWSHYADAHRGVVLRFRSIPAFDSQFGVARPVNYVQEVPLFNTEDEIIEFMGGGSVPAPATLADRFILTKHISWSYENEWRLQAGHGRDKTAKFEDVGFGRNELDGIIFGLNASSDDQRAIVSLAKAYPNATLFKSVKVGTSFDLMIKEVTSDLF